MPRGLVSGVVFEKTGKLTLKQHQQQQVAALAVLAAVPA